MEGKIMGRTSDRSVLIRLLVFFLIPALLSLPGCKSVEKESEVTIDPVMDLLNQTYFFEKSPEELYFAKVSQDTDSEQGATIKYLSAFHDGEATYIFFDVTDTGSDLFSKGSNGFDFSLDQYDFLEKTGYNDSRQYDLVSYDEQTRTATMCVEYIGPLQTEDLSFHIYSMTGNQKMINMDFDDIDLYKMMKETPGEFEPEDEYAGAGTSFGVMDEQTGVAQPVEMPEFEEGNGSTVYRLKKDVLSVPIEDDEGNHVADITNIGWRNGWLHVQINPENKINWQTNFNLKKNQGDELIYSPFHLSFGAVRGEEAQNDYYEYVFYVGDLTRENLDCIIAFQNAFYRATTLKGDWEIKLSIPDSLLKILEADKAVPLEDRELLIRRAVISPVNITLFSSRKDIPEENVSLFYGIGPEDLNIKIIYRDGSSAEVPKETGHSFGNQKGKMFRFIYTAENFSDIAGLEVNGILFPAGEQ